MKPHETLDRFDDYLAGRGLTLNAVVIGGAALSLLGVITRETRDCDVMHPALTDEIIEAAKAFAIEMSALGSPLAEDWLNNNPAEVAELLPKGWLARSQVVFAGKALTVLSLCRADLLLTKLFAYCDRGTDIGDCFALKPGVEELREARLWVEKQDANPDWPKHVEESLRDLARRLGYEL
jgi:hypothetical protein